MYRTIYQVVASENLRAACTFRNAPVMKTGNSVSVVRCTL